MMVAVEEVVSVGMGELATTKDSSTVLVAYGLGSCVGVCVYDPIARVGGMAHVMLPDSREAKQIGTPCKFADRGVPILLDEVVRLGAYKQRLVIKIAGGAQMIVAPGFVDKFNIGGRNIAAVHRALVEAGLRISSSDVGGNIGRTLHLFMDSGRVFVRMAGRDNREL